MLIRRQWRTFLFASLLSISISSRHGEAYTTDWKREMRDLNKGEYNLMITAIGFLSIVQHAGRLVWRNDW